jgi:hypothetical protein
MSADARGPDRSRSPFATQETAMERPSPLDEPEFPPESAPDSDPEEKTRTTVTPLDPDEKIKDGGIDVNET